MCSAVENPTEQPDNCPDGVFKPYAIFTHMTPVGPRDSHPHDVELS